MERLGWKEFEKRVSDHFGERLECDFSERACRTGPDHTHKFDLVSSNGDVIIECKSYTWTSGGHFPTAKIATANEALLFLGRVQAKRKMLVMQDDLDSNGTSLVHSYVGRYGGLMDDVEVWRYNPSVDGPNSIERVREAGEVYEPQEVTIASSQQTTDRRSGRIFSGKYAPLYEELADTRRDRVQYRFKDINQLLDDRLPDSAYRYRVWWNKSGHSHAEGWESIGWTVSSLNLSDETVEFAKTQDGQV